MIPNRSSVVFLHIPRTGGMSLRSLLEREYPSDCTFTVNAERMETSVDEFKRWSRMQKCCLLQGHMWFGLHDYMPQPCVYLTLLREPVVRFVSHYYFAKSAPGHYLYKLLNADGGLSLRNYALRALDDSRFAEVHNGQVRPIAAQSEPSVEVAERRLKDHFLVGLTESFVDSTRMMSKALGWKYWNASLCEVRNQHPHPSLSELPRDAVEAIERAVDLGLELYDYGRTLFAEQLRRYS